MPSLNKRERVEAIMRYIHNHPDDINTADTIAYGTKIPTASVRQTLYRDYPMCFDRDSEDRRNITLNHLMWPDNRIFDMEVKETTRTVKKLKTKHLSDIDTNKYLSGELGLLLAEWMKNPIHGSKPPPKEYWTLLNTLNTAIMYLQLLRAPDVQKKLKELVEEPDNLPPTVYATVKAIEKARM